MIYVVQLAARHKPNGPFWTGQGWSKPEHGKLFASVDEALGAAWQASLSAVRTVAVIEDGKIIERIAPKHSNSTLRGGFL